jgi:diacylglycerol kinase (ATP)
VQRLLRSFRYAFRGLGYLFATQPNVRIHLFITLAVIIVGLWVGLPRRDWAIIAAVTGLVFAAEALNTALEATVDLVSPHEDALAGAAKDVGAAAVTLAALAALVVGILILGPALWEELASLGF